MEPQSINQFIIHSPNLSCNQLSIPPSIRYISSIILVTQPSIHTLIRSLHQLINEPIHQSNQLINSVLSYAFSLYIHTDGNDVCVILASLYVHYHFLLSTYYVVDTSLQKIEFGSSDYQSWALRESLLAEHRNAYIQASWICRVFQWFIWKFIMALNHALLEGYK